MFPHFATKECQKKDWPFHKRECSSLQEWAKAAPSADLALPSDAVRCLGRLLWTRQKKGSTSKWVSISVFHHFVYLTLNFDRPKKLMRCGRVSEVSHSSVHRLIRTVDYR